MLETALLVLVGALIGFYVGELPRKWIVVMTVLALVLLVLVMRGRL